MIVGTEPRRPGSREPEPWPVLPERSALDLSVWGTGFFLDFLPTLLPGVVLPDPLRQFRQVVEHEQALGFDPGVALDKAPRPPPDERGAQARPLGGGQVVVDTVADVEHRG